VASLAPDMVGHSFLMERDEGRTLALKAHRREFVEPLIAEYQGRIVKLMRDSALCEFASVVDAVRCAVLIQRGMAEREAAVPEAERIRFRIGINLGDVIHDEGDLYGDGVNVAAHLEGLAAPGGICVSRTVHECVRGKVALGFQAPGPRRVKNIAEPVEAYRVDLASVPARPRGGVQRRRLLAAVAAGLLLTLAGR
jgi:adenylate cyclase